MRKIKVGDFEIGGDECYIIADVGSNHLQDLSLAKESIDAVAESGANAVKFQSIQLNQLYLNPDPKTAEFIRSLEFPEEWHQELNDYAEKKGITFFSSPTYLGAIDLLEEINVPLYKIASAQIGTFPQLVERVAKLNKPTIFSTGISDFKNTEKAIEIFEKAGNDQFMILHCNSIYPTPPEKVNMPLMDVYREKFKNPIGFSDHTIGTHISVNAVSRGAKLIEKHFTLDRNFNAPDSNDFACDPQELKLLVNQIRDIEAANREISQRNTIEPEEKAFKDSILYKLIANNDLNVGQKIGLNDVSFLRHPSGIDCREFFENGNMAKVKTKVNSGELISKDSIIFE
ncbi:MAG: N-acetylneuraminate synthase family protein [Crocinitomicaceae bacterium]